MDPLEIVVKAGPHLRRACPVWVQLPVPPDPRPTLSILDSAGTEVPSQVEVVGMGSDERLALAFIVRDLAAGEVRGYRIVPGPPVELLHNPLPEAPPTDTNSSLPTAATPDLAGVAAEVTSSVAVSTEGADPDTPLVVVTETPREKVPGVFLDEVDGRLLIEIDGDLFTAYHFGSDVTRPYFHPLVGPTGASVVRDFPMVEGVDGETSDHPHHRGMWTAHGDVNGHDNWLEGLGKASIRHSGFPRLISGPVYGSFDASAEWIDRWGSVALTDTRRVTVFNLGPDERLVEYAIRVSASHGQVTFGDTKEAGIVSIRVASSMDGPTRDRPGGKGKIETADGSVGEAEAWVLEQMIKEPAYMPGIPLAAETGAAQRYGDAK